MKTIVSWFAGNHVAANLMMVFILAAGTLTAFGIIFEVLPETDLNKIQISVVYPGASPEDVVDGVIRPIEENIAGIENIRRIDSTAREGLAIIVVEVIYGADVKQLLEDVRSEIDRMTTLPKQAETPKIQEMTQRKQVISIAVYGDAPEATLKHIAQRVKDDITNIEGVTQAELVGHRPSEIHVEISEETLRKYRLTLGKVAKAISESTLDLPAGSVKAAEGEILIRSVGRRYSAHEYRDIPIITRLDGTRIDLAQIADIREGFADIDLFARFQQKPAIIINIFRVADQSVLDVAEKVKKFVAKARTDLPHGISMDCFQDMSAMTSRSIDLLMKNLLIGLILVSLILALFLNVRLAFWVTLGIPVSFAFGLIFLPHYDISLNMVSLLAFILVAGIVVDDAIIIGENIFLKHEEGMKPFPAAVDGTLEVGKPIVFSILTTMVAFWPLMVAGGVIGNIMRNVAVVAIAVLLGSLIESLLILPAHLQRSKGMIASSDLRPKRMSVALHWFIGHPYDKILKICVKWRYMTIATGIAVLMLMSGLLAAGIVRFTFFPGIENDVMRCALTMPAGTPESRTLEVARQIETAAETMLKEQDRRRGDHAAPMMEHSITIIGAHVDPLNDDLVRDSEFGGHLATIFVQLIDSDQRDIGSIALCNLWRDQLGSISDVESIVFSSDFRNMGTPIEIHLSMDDPLLLVAAKKALKEKLQTFSGVFDIADNYIAGKTELQIALKPEASATGLMHGDLALQVRHGFYGAEALRFQRGHDEVRVLVRYPENERRCLSKVASMRIRTPSLGEVPFSEVARSTMTQGYMSIDRSNRKRVVKVTANVDATVVNANEVRRFMRNDFLPELAERYPGLHYAMEGEAREQAEVFIALYRNAIIALLGIYVLLAVLFRSFFQPFIVMAAIPFGILGAVIGHLVLGFSISFMSLFGMVGLAGVVVNDALVLIDRINRNCSCTGTTTFCAVVAGSKARFRAVVLTSATTFAGLTPIMLEKSPQAQFLIPMAISMSFGVLFATVVTLLLVPALYMINEDARKFFGYFNSL